MELTIYELLAAKDYTQLNLQEKKIIREHMTEQDYCIARENIISASAIFDKEIQHIEYDNELLNKLNAISIARQSLWTKMINTKVPLLKAVAVFIIAFMSYVLLLQENKPDNIENTSILPIVNDTIFITKREIIEIFDTIYIKLHEPNITSNQKKLTSNKSEKKSINTTDAPNYKKIYAQEALQNINSPKTSSNRGISVSIQDNPTVSEVSISDFTFYCMNDCNNM